MLLIYLIIMDIYVFKTHFAISPITRDIEGTIPILFSFLAGKRIIVVVV